MSSFSFVVVDGDFFFFFFRGRPGVAGKSREVVLLWSPVLETRERRYLCPPLKRLVGLFDNRENDMARTSFGQLLAELYKHLVAETARVQTREAPITTKQKHRSKQRLGSPSENCRASTARPLAS